VEPHPTTFSFLCDNLALNGVNAMKLQCALDSEVGVKSLENEGAVFQTLSDSAGGTKVMTLQLDSLIPARRDLKLLIKMDIEGSEVAVLDHWRAQFPEQTFIFIELHGGDKSLRWMEEWARRNGFQFSQARRRDDAIDGYLMRDLSPVQGMATRRSATKECVATIASNARRGEDTVTLPAHSQDSIVSAISMRSSV
jgi:FkbM family methyltransferase